MTSSPRYRSEWYEEYQKYTGESECRQNENKSKSQNRYLKKYQHDKSVLVDILQDTQAEIGYLPEEALEVDQQRAGRTVKPGLQRRHLLQSFQPDAAGAAI